MIKLNKLIANAAVLSVILAAALLMYVIYLILVPIEVFKVNQTPLPIAPPQVKSGQIVSVELDYCKERDIPTDIVIDFIGQAVVASLATQRELPVGCHVKFLPITVPLSTPTGAYSIRLHLTHQVTQLQKKSQYFYTKSINVVNSIDPNNSVN